MQGAAGGRLRFSLVPADQRRRARPSSAAGTEVATGAAGPVRPADAPVPRGRSPAARKQTGALEEPRLTPTGRPRCEDAWLATAMLAGGDRAA